MNSTWHILFLGIAFFQMIFMLVQWVLFRRKEYLFYIAYILFAGSCIMFRVNAADGFLNVQLPKWLQELLRQPLAILSYYMYLLFARYFLSLKTVQPKVYRYSRVIEVVFVAYFITIICSIPFQIPYQVSGIVYKTMIIIVLCFVIPMAVLMLRQKDVLNNFLVVGSLCYIGGGVISMLLFLLMPPSSVHSNLTVLMGLEIGVLIELLLLNTGFALKNRILQQQVIKGQQKIMQQFMEEQKRKTVE
jgi:hypothetical protein